MNTAEVSGNWGKTVERILMIRNTVIVTVLMVLLGGCSNVWKINKDDELYHHLVRMERDGQARSIDTGEVTSVSVFENDHLKAIKSKIEENADLKTIVIYVHGAPIFGEIGVKESRQIMEKVRGSSMEETASENSYKVHPIIFNWDGSLGDVYTDHLFRVRNGQNVSMLRGFSTAIGYLAADLFGSFGTALATWSVQVNHIAETEYPKIDLSGEKKEAKRRQTEILNKQANQPCERCFLISDTELYKPKISLDTVIDTTRAVPILAVSPFIASFGRSAWKNYDRRTKLAVRQSREFSKDSNKGDAGDETPTGMFAVLMDGILRSVVSDSERADCKDPIEVVMIGHSTGAMILSEYLGTLIARAGKMKMDGVPGADAIKKIVFLGAATTVGQFGKTIVPFLQWNKDAEFFNITLNAYNERKASYWGVFQTSSLLEWLDNSIAQPSSHLDRVIGKWENIMLAVHTIPPEIRGRVHLKQLMKDHPEKHGELDDWNVDPFDEEKWKVKQRHPVDTVKYFDEGMCRKVQKHSLLLR